MVERAKRVAPFWADLNDTVRRAVVLVVIVALGALGFVVWNKVTHCAPNADRVDGQCIGITDGTDGPVFGPGSAAALAAIGAENTRIAGLPFVTVAYVVTRPKPGVEDTYAAQLDGDLMGVAVAQREANIGAARPSVRVLVVNVGDSASPSITPIEKLIDMAHGGFAKDRLMAVAVSGKSLAPFAAQVDALVAAEIPVIVSHLTAEQITTTALPSGSPLIRIAPINTEEAVAAANYLQDRSTALIVQNNDPNDRWAQSLGAGFRARFPATPGHTLLLPDEPYNGSRDGVTNAMKGISREICERKPDVVFFAGRASDLTPLVSALSDRPCRTTPVEIMTGDDGILFASDVAEGTRPELRAALENGVSVKFTALAHPGAWASMPAAFGSTDYLTGDCAACLRTLFPGYSPDDGFAVMAYDAINTAVYAMRSPNGPVDTPGALIQEFSRLHGKGAVPGASGWISLNGAGNTINKAVSITRVLPTGRVEFTKVSSPSGEPCIPDRNTC